jgi:hypothetical protein
LVAAINRNTERNIDIAESACRFVEPRSIAVFFFCGKHPVCGAFNALKVFDARACHIEEHFRNSHACAGGCGDETFEWRFAEGKGGSGTRKVALRCQTEIRERKVIWSDTLLPRNEAGNASVDFCGKKPF